MKALIRISLLTLYAFCTAVYAIGQRADSLEKAIARMPDSRAKAEAILALPETGIDFEKSIAYANQGLLIAGNLKDSLLIGRLKRAAGVAYYFNGQYEQAAVNYYTSLQILESSRQDRELAYTLNALAKLYRKTRELDKAAHYYDRALSLFRQVKDSSGMEMIWNESGVVFEYKQDYNEAIRRYGIARDFAIALKDSTGLGYAYNFLAGVYTLKKQYAEAEQYMNSCLHIREQLRDTFSLALGYADMGQLFLAKKDYENAMSYLEQSNRIAIRMKYRELTAANYQQMADVARSSGNYQQALTLTDLATALHDSIFALEKAKQIEELNTRYQTKKKEQQLLAQQLALTRKNYFIAGVVIVAVALLLLSLSYYRRQKLKQEKRMQQELIRQQDMATKAVLEAEEKERQRIAMELHDGIGQMMSAVKINLSTFQSEVDLQDEEAKQKLDTIFSLVDDSCREVRAVSHNMMPNALLKSGLAAAIRAFLDKIDSRVLEVHLYTEGLQEHIDQDIEIMLYRIIQECVNNVIKHAKASRLDIMIIKEETVSLTITVEDNGVGFDKNKKDIFEGIGLKNIISRVQYLKGEVEFDTRQGKGTVITIFIPLTRNT